MNRRVADFSLIVPVAVGFWSLSQLCHPAVAAPAPDAVAVLAAVCPLQPTDTAGLRRVLTGGRLLEARLDGPVDKPFRAVHRILMPEGGEWVVNRLSPGGRLRRISLEWHAPAPAGPRPVLAVNASGDCRVTEGRRLIYDSEGRAETLEVLSADLAEVVFREALNPPVPAGPPTRGCARRRHRHGRQLHPAAVSRALGAE